MTSIGDSDAIHDRERLFVQHQAALTLLQGALADPDLQEYRWLDLACGKGQIIVHLEANIPPQARAKILYHGFDVDNQYARFAEQTAESSGLKGSNVAIGNLAEFSGQYPAELRFEFDASTPVSRSSEIPRLAPRSVNSSSFSWTSRATRRRNSF